jgi:hypothetical protein
LLIQPINAQTWEKTKRLTWNSGSSSTPKAAVDSDNHIHVVWQDKTPGNYEIFYKKSTNRGITWSTKRLSWTSGISKNPAIAVDSGNIHVVWCDETPGNAEIYYKRSTNGGVTWGGIKRLTWNLGGSYVPEIAADSGQIHVVWEDSTPGNYEIYYKKSTNGGETWGSVKRITWNTGGSNSPAIAVDSSNTIHIVWHDLTPGNWEIYYKRSTNGGVSWGDIKRLTWSFDTSYGPAIAIDSSDNIHAAWHDASSGNNEIYHKRSTNGGVTWDSTKRLTWNAASSNTPAIAVDSSDGIHMSWTDFTPGNAEISYKRSTNNGVTWESTKRLTWNTGYSVSPAIAVDLSKTIHVFWHDSFPGNYEIYYKKGGQ